MKHGGKSTWQNPQGQRVPLKEGRVQLKLEGSEIQFRDWEIRLLKQDHLYGEWYVEGCRDPACKEYSASANLHIQTLCLTPVPVSLGKSVPGFHAPGS